MTTTSNIEKLLDRLTKAWHNHDDQGRVFISMKDARELCENVLPSALPPAEAGWLLVAHSNTSCTGPATLTWCATKMQVLAAVSDSMFAGESLDESEAMEATGVTEELFEHGRYDFEGDPPLQLIALTPPSASGPRIHLDVDRYPEDSFRPKEEQKVVSAWNRHAISPAELGGVIYQCMCTDEDHIRNGPKDIWMDVDAESFTKISQREDVRSRILYTTPRAAEAVSEDDVRRVAGVIKTGLDHYPRDDVFKLARAAIAALTPPSAAKRE